MAKEIDKSGQLSEETKEALSFLSELANKQLTLYKLTITDELKKDPSFITAKKVRYHSHGIVSFIQKCIPAWLYYAITFSPCTY